jgi:PAS domain-containing protein
MVQKQRVSGVHLVDAGLAYEYEVQSVELEMQNDELRRLQRELEASRADYRELFDWAPVAMFVIGQGHRIRLANAAAAELLATPQSTLGGVRLSRFVAEADAAAFEQHRRDVIGSKERVRARLTLDGPAGSRSVIFQSSCIDPTLEEWRTAVLDAPNVDSPSRRERRSDRPSFPPMLPANLAIVVVADDSRVRRVAVEYFRCMGCDAIDTTDGFEALEALKANSDRPVVVLADAGLRSVGRPEFVVAARAVVPDVGIARTPMQGERTGLVATPGVDLGALYDAVLRALAEVRR